MSRELPISDVRPTQLYISRKKLAEVLEWFDVDTVEYEPSASGRTVSSHSQVA